MSLPLNREQRVSELRERGGEYRFLSRLLAGAPDIGLLADAESLGLIEQFLPAQTEALALEYTRLFSAPGSARVPAHQSIYTDVIQLEPSAAASTSCGMSFPGGAFPGFLGGKSCTDASRWYAETGFVPSTHFQQMADHVSVELDFVAHLYLMEARALENSCPDDAEAYSMLREKFRAEFLDRWLRAFAQRLSSNEVSGFYRRVGNQIIDEIVTKDVGSLAV